MIEGVSTTQILINLIVQVINLALFFFVFKYFVGDKLIKALEERRALTKKLKDADATYQHIISDAQKESQKIIADASDHRRRVVEEAVSLSEKRGQEIMQSAERKAAEIKSQAEIRAQQMSNELEKEFATSVKQTSQLVVEKLLGNTQKLQEEYLDTLVTELTHTK